MEEVHRAARAQEADADPEEAPEENEVREVRQVQDVRARPPDKGKLDEKHQETQKAKPNLVVHAIHLSGAQGRLLDVSERCTRLDPSTYRPEHVITS
jgi:hypothetical protein